MKTFAVLLRNKTVFKDGEIKTVPNEYEEQMGSFAYLRLDSRNTLDTQIQDGKEFMLKSGIDKPIGFRIGTCESLREDLNYFYEFIK